MKILAFSDLHRDVDAAKIILDSSGDADLLIGAGDFATTGQGAGETLSLLAQSAKPVIVVHGNHDDPKEIAGICQPSESLHYLHGQSLSFGGIRFFGLGGEIPSRNGFPWNAAESENRAADMLLECPDDAILITHTPPFELSDLQKGGSHEGSKAIKAHVLAHQPKLVLCGHIHNAWGMTATCGATLVQNLGPTINWFEV